MIKRLTLAAGLAATLLLSGCGSSQPMTKAEYIRRSDEICAKAAKADKGIPTSSSLVEVMAAEKRIVGDAIHDLRALDRPRGLDAELDEWFAALDDEERMLDRAANAGDHPGVSALDDALREADRVDARVRKAASRVGFHACAD